jgi:two-component system response regulator AtoC
MTKRLVVLHDEQFILAELARLTAYKASTAAAHDPAVPESRPEPAAMAPPPLAEPAAAAPASTAGGPAAAAAVDTDAGGVAVDAPPETAPSTEGLSLHELARAAAQQAERQAINDALTRFRWNRRKTAAYLKVSYKTLLNKMKECGIRGAELA